MEESKKQLMQETINRLLYNSEYEAALLELNKKYPVNKDVKNNVSNFHFQEEKI